MSVITADPIGTPLFTTFGPEVIDYFRSMAGPDYTWNIIRGSRPSSSGYRKGLRMWLYTFQSSTCAFCGDYERLGYMEMCHIIPKRGMDAGYLPGNIGLGCRACNESHNDNPVAYGDIRRPELIAVHWPSRRECESVARMA